MKKIYKIKNKLLFRLMVIAILSIIIGILYISILNTSNIEKIKKSLQLFFKGINKLDYTKAIINCITSNLFYLVLVWILGISIIGIPIIILVIILKSFILGFSISSILYFYKFKGILIALFYSVPLIINLAIIIFLGYYAIIFSKNLNKLLFLKQDISFKNIMRRYIKILLFCTCASIISGLIEIYAIPSLLKFLQIG